MKTPFFGPAYTARSLNLAAQSCINVFPVMVETRTGKEVGALYNCPGLDLLVTVGSGPLRGLGVLGQTLYAVSGNQVYSINQSYTATLLGTIATSRGPVSIIENGTQLVIFDGVRGYLVPGGFPLTGGNISDGGIEYAIGDQIFLVSTGGGLQTATAMLTVTAISGSGYPLTGGIISDGGSGYATGNTITLTQSGGTQVEQAIATVTGTGSGVPLTGGTVAGTMGGYAVGDLITLSAIGGTQVSPAILQVATASGGSVLTVTVLDPGLFSTDPTSFAQASTSGSGTGFTYTSPTFGSFASGVVIGFSVSTAGLFSVQPTSFSQQSTSGSGTGFAIVDPAFGAATSTGTVTGFSVTMSGAFNPQPTSFAQASTSGSGDGFTLSSPTYGALNPIYTLQLPFPGPIAASYQDGFGVANQLGTDTWYQSNLFDLSYWDPLNFSSADSQPDDIVSIYSLHREFFLFKQETTEVWVNAGQAGFTFQRLEGVFIQMGCAAQFSVALAGESLIWLAANQQGQGQVMMVTGYEPVKISTEAIDTALAGYCQISDAIAYAYQEEGELFYVITFPEAGVTWCYDVTASRLSGVPMWHQRAAFSNGQLLRHQGNCFAFYNNTKIVGDYMSGNLYALDPNTLTDNGAQRKWVRSWRALAQPVFEPVKFSALQIDMQTGIDIPDGTNPQCVLRWSDDGGHNWSNEVFAAAGPPGATAQRVKFRRLGSTRRNSGLDRYFELSSTDPFPTALIGADLT
jgi:hypothetical protein